MTTAPAVGPGVTADTVLACVTEARRTEDRAAADILALAADWADLHPALDPDWSAGFGRRLHRRGVSAGRRRHPDRG